MLLNKDKKIIQDFEELLDSIKSSTPINKKETPGEKSKRIKLLLSNYEEFCMYYFPEYCFAPFSAFHKTIQKEIAEQPNQIFLAQWSRGFAKSTHLGLFLPLFLKFNNHLNGMMLGSYNEKMAAERLADLQGNLQANNRIIHDFGEQFSYGNWEDGAFKTRDGVGFYAFGKKQTPRGTRFKWNRPNYGLIDDLNDARHLDNEDIANDDKEWVLEEFKPALWTRKWWLPIAQNKFHDNSVTSLIENDKAVKKKIHRVDILDKRGESNWIENPDFSKEAIEDLRQTESGGFIRERMNTPYQEGKDFKAKWLNEWADCDTQDYNSVLIHYLDPSYKSTDKSDYKAWILLGKTGKYYDVIDCWIRKATSKDMWERAFEVDNDESKYTIQHCMEANFIQEDVHRKELERVEEDEGRPLRLLYDHRKKDGKLERILTMQPLFQRLLIRFNINKADSEDMKLLRAQILAIRKGSTVKDDGPDALEGAIWMADRHQPRRGSGTRSGKYKKNLKRSM